MTEYSSALNGGCMAIACKLVTAIIIFGLCVHVKSSMNSSAQDSSGSINFLNNTPKTDSFLKDVLQTIDAHMSNEFFCVKILCREIGVSERQLQRKLKAIVNKSPNQLITSVRLYQARELLLEFKYNVAEAAFKTGFSSPSYFSKRFKREFGVCPSSLLEDTESLFPKSVIVFPKNNFGSPHKIIQKDQLPVSKGPTIL